MKNNKYLHMKKVILVGYMGSGKTQVGKVLATLCGFPFIDLDYYIEQKIGNSIPNIFKEQGEIYFRKQEHESLKELLNRPESFVLSTGGGTPCYAENHLFLKEPEVISVYLKTSVTELSARLENEIEQRPILKNLKEEPLSDFIAKHLFDRSFYYHQAKYIVSTDNKSPRQIADEILKLPELSC